MRFPREQLANDGRLTVRVGLTRNELAESNLPSALKCQLGDVLKERAAFYLQLARE